MEKGKQGKTKAEIYREAIAMLGTPDYAKGVETMQSLAENGYAFAQYKLGFMYYKGRGVDRDYVKAAEWYRKAAEWNHTAMENEPYEYPKDPKWYI